MNDFMQQHNLTDEQLDEMAVPYEQGNFELSTSPIHTGSHLDAVGTKRVTVLYPADTAQRVAALARTKGVKPSEIYRTAVEKYLAHA